MLNAVFRLAAPWACAWAMGAHAAQAAEAPSPEPAASAPFRHYQGWRDEPLHDWRKANDRVGEIGGWRTYLREAQPEGGAGQDAPDHAGPHGH